jgi:hypothetical protein
VQHQLCWGWANWQSETMFQAFKAETGFSVLPTLLCYRFSVRSGTLPLAELTFLLEIVFFAKGRGGVKLPSFSFLPAFSFSFFLGYTSSCFFLFF